MRPFGCLVIILNTIDHLGGGPNWLFDIDALTKSMNYKPVVAGNQSNGSVGTKTCDNAGKARVETVPGKDYILLPLWTQDPPFSSSSKDFLDAGFKPSGGEEKKMMHKKFHMSSMGELTFFLGLNVKQKNDGIFISQDKYVTEILKKFGFSDVKTASTPMETHKPLLKDVDVCVCARFQVNPKISHLHAVKRIFRYLKGQPKLGFWYPKDLPFDLVAYTDSDYAGASLDRNYTIGDCQFLGCKLISWKLLECLTSKVLIEGRLIVHRIIHKGWLKWNATTARDEIEVKTEVNAIYDTPSHTKKIFANMRRQEKDFSGKVTPLFETMLIQQQAEVGEGHDNPLIPSTHPQLLNPNKSLPSSSQLKKTHRPRKAKRATEISQSSGPIPLVADETVTKEREDRMKRAVTTASSLEAEQDSEVQTRFETAFKQSYDPPLSRVNTLGSGEDILKLKELMELCTKLSARVLDLETTKTAHAKKIVNLKKRVKKLKRKRKSRTSGMNLFKIEVFEESNFDDEDFDADMDEVFKDVEGDAEQVISAAADEVSTGDAVNTAGTEPVTTASASVVSVSVTTVEPSTPPTTTIFEDEDLTIAQTLVKMKSEKSKVRVVTIQEPSESGTRTTTSLPQHDQKDKGKGKMVEQEKPLKRKDQIKFEGPRLS
ncbi:uncharacterized mitochondrial protein-like protein [Tanacetum coccineum]